MSQSSSSSNSQAHYTPDQVSQVSQRRGNTKTRRERARKWVFTLNNHSVSDVSTILKFLSDAKSYCIQEEIGSDKKTPHLQGCFAFHGQISFSTLKKKHPKWHLERCKDWKASVKYCQKAETRKPDGKQWFKNVRREVQLIDYFEEAKATAWQREIINIIKGPVDRRKVYWYWSEAGSIGKTTLARHLVLKHGCVLLGGKERDILFACAKLLENDGTVPPVVINLPRCVGNHCSYKAMETLKDGLAFSSKYESGMLKFNPVHVVVFANTPPDAGKLSSDRWIVTKI